MGDYGAGPLDALRDQVKAIRSETARLGTTALRAAALDGRERVVRRHEPLPERVAALDAQVGARLDVLGDSVMFEADAEAPGRASCDILWSLAAASFELADETTLFDEIDTYTELGYMFLGSALDCVGGGS